MKDSPGTHRQRRSPFAVLLGAQVSACLQAGPRIVAPGVRDEVGDKETAAMTTQTSRRLPSALDIGMGTGAPPLSVNRQVPRGLAMARASLNNPACPPIRHRLQTAFYAGRGGGRPLEVALIDRSGQPLEVCTGLVFAYMHLNMRLEKGVSHG